MDELPGYLESIVDNLRAEYVTKFSLVGKEGPSKNKINELEAKLTEELAHFEEDRGHEFVSNTRRLHAFRMYTYLTGILPIVTGTTKDKKLEFIEPEKNLGWLRPSALGFQEAYERFRTDPFLHQAYSSLNNAFRPTNLWNNTNDQTTYTNEVDAIFSMQKVIDFHGRQLNYKEDILGSEVPGLQVAQSRKYSDRDLREYMMGKWPIRVSGEEHYIDNRDPMKLVLLVKREKKGPTSYVHPDPHLNGLYNAIQSRYRDGESVSFGEMFTNICTELGIMYEGKPVTYDMVHQWKNDMKKENGNGNAAS